MNMNSKMRTVMRNYIYTIMAVAALLASCTKESTGDIQSEKDQIERTKGITTLNVSTDEATKTVVSSEDNTRILWETGDQIVAFSQCDSDDPLGGMIKYSVLYSLKDGAGTTSGTFEMVSDPRYSSVDIIYTIVYPSDAFVTAYGNYGLRDHIRCTIPTVQKARKGSFDKAAAVMYALPENHTFQEDDIANLQLKYAVNFLKVTVSETEHVSSIKISSSNALTGNVEISKDGIQPSESDTEKYVVLKAEDGQVMEPGDYYIAVMPGTIEKPVITYRFDHSIKTKAGSGSITFAEGKNVKPIKVDFSKGDVSGAVQLWANGPYWSVKNVGAQTIYDPGYYFSWGNTTGYVYDSSISKWKVAPGYPNAGTIWNGGFSWSHYYGSHGQSLQRDLQANASDDAAVAAWGSDWRMPTRADADGFKGNVTSTKSSDGKYIKVNGQGDYLNDYIILPIGGTGYNETNDNIIVHWSRTSTYYQRSGDNNKVYSISVSGTNQYPIVSTGLMGNYGMNIRPVLVNTDF